MNFTPWFILAGLCLAISLVVFMLARGMIDGRHMRRISAQPGSHPLEGDGGQD